MQPSIDDVLRSSFGLNEFRPWQRQAIEALLGKMPRVLVVAPTGGGKSLTYQLPSMVLEGTTLVICPLVALMEDQVRSLRARGIPATYIASTLEAAERYEREAGLLNGDYKLVYVAPERLASDAFVEKLSRAKISFVAIDEAHCIAQWGHDFRPDYLRIGALLERIRPKRVLACTATATPDVRDEIREQLGWNGETTCTEVLRGFARPNLHLEAKNVDGPKEARERLISFLTSTIGDPKNAREGAIVYAATRKASEEYAELLKKRGYHAAYYHAGMDGDARSKIADRFASRKLNVVVATNAFGMGIDRPDIRAVVHVQPPSSIEAYYQEVGRAGRDGNEAKGLLLCSGADISLRRRLVMNSSNGGPADPELAQRGWKLFRDLLRYIDARTCRHDFVLRYFGDEQETLGGCGHCDVCLSEDAPETDEDGTLIVQKALSAVARAQKRAGITAIAEMLRGTQSEKTRKFGFTSLSTFGLLSDYDQPWILSLLRTLLAAGWIDLTPTEHPVPFLTRTGAAVMKGEIAARVVLPPPTKAKRSRGERAASANVELSGHDRQIFEGLRAHRASVAKSRGVPAYVVALDRTLIELTLRKPKNASELLHVFGMGPARAEQYGEGFLRVLHDS